jgi:hypothetical protein
LVGDQLATQLAFAADPAYAGDTLVLLSLARRLRRPVGDRPGR